MASCDPKRQKTAALQDAGADEPPLRSAARFWSAAVLCRFGSYQTRRHSFVIRHWSFVIIPLFLFGCISIFAGPDYSAVDAIFGAHCMDCHAANDPEGQFVLE